MTVKPSNNGNSDQPHVNTSLSLLACQVLIPEVTNQPQRDQHLQRSARLVTDKLKTQSTDLVVLPELSTIDYSRQCFEQLDQLAETDHGASFQCWSAVAKANQCAVVYGFPRRKGNGFTISSAAVSAGGELIGIYDKIHLAQFGDSMEKEYFNLSGRQLLVFDIAGFRIAPIICYDIRFPELCRELVLNHQVDLILHVGAYARDESFYSWHAFATTRAVENQCFLLSLNRASPHFGQSVFCYPWIDQDSPPISFSNDKEEFRHLVIDKSRLTEARENFTFLKDRLNDYALPITEKSKQETG